MTPYYLTFELNGLPKMTNTSGARSTHWRFVKTEKDKWKTLVRLTLRSLKLPPSPLPRASLTLTRFSSTAPDPDGLVSGFKTIIDSLVTGGVLENDRFPNIGMPQYLWVKAKPKEGKVRIEVTGLI